MSHQKLVEVTMTNPSLRLHDVWGLVVSHKKLVEVADHVKGRGSRPHEDIPNLLFEVGFGSSATSKYERQKIGRAKMES